MSSQPELRHEGSYVTVHPILGVDRTVQVRPDLHVDLAVDGRVIGVERVGAPVSVGDLAAVLFALPFPPAEPVEDDEDMRVGRLLRRAYEADPDQPTVDVSAGLADVARRADPEYCITCGGPCRDVRAPRVDTPMTDPHADALARADRALREALSAVESALASRPAVRVVHTGDGWQPPPEPLHTCGERCDELACEVTADEVRRAHREAERRVEWLRRFMPEEESDG